MTNKEFQNLKKGDKVMFQQCGGNKINGHIVAVADIWENGQIVVPRPDCGNELCVFPYRSLKLVK